MKYDIYNKTGDVLFTAEIECDEDDLRPTMRGLATSWAIANKVSLFNADLEGANLRYFNLSNADLSGAHLRRADLYGADLSWANLSNANLYNADLRDADLYSANLYLLQTDIWPVYIQPKHIRIGCQYHTADEWFSFSDEEIDVMSPEALDWWRKWKAPIQAIHATFKGE